MSTLKLKDVSYIINDNGKERKILNNINYDFENGKMTVVTGPSGSGKTTLIYAIAGLIKNISGNIFFDNIDINSLKKEEDKDKFRLNNISMVFQNLNLFSFLNVEDNILMPFYAKKMRVDDKIRKNLSEYLKLLNLEGIEKKSISSLSGGEQQRVAIIRAIMQNSKIILCDEPTASLDSENVEIFMNYLTKIKKETNHTIIISTHDSRVSDYAEVNLKLNDGKIII